MTQVPGIWFLAWKCVRDANWGSTRHFCPKCQLWSLRLILHIGGVKVSGTPFWLWKLVQIMYWWSSCRLFKKFQSFPLILWLQIFGVLRYQKVKYEHENSSGLTIEGLNVDFAKNVNLILWSYNGIFGVLWHQKRFRGNGWQLRTLTSIYHRILMLSSEN